jgi:hypothetical protein
MGTSMKGTATTDAATAAMKSATVEAAPATMRPTATLRESGRSIGNSEDGERRHCEPAQFSGFHDSSPSFL